MEPATFLRGRIDAPHRRWTPAPLLTMLCIVAMAGASSEALAVTFFVDASAGSDGNDGRSESAALATVAAVNGLALGPGDRVLFRRGQSFAGSLDINDNGTSAARIVIGAWGPGTARPRLFGATVRGDFVTLEGLLFDHEKDASDTVRIRDARDCIIRDAEIRNGTRDGIDAAGARNLLIEDVEIHHLLNGSLGSQDDAHGIVATNTDGITIRNADIHHVSGDAFQADPNRVPGQITQNVLIEGSTLWTGPLEADFNAGWRAGDSPGENAIDTKVVTSGFESEPRMQLVVRDTVAYGWTASPAIPNRAAFNLKEKIAIVLDRVTVFDSEIAFRLRGARGNADTTIRNTVIFDTDIAIRTEDGLGNLRVEHTTFGRNIGQTLRIVGSADTGSWNWTNNAFVGPVPSIGGVANLAADASDFASLAADDYRLAPGSALIDAGALVAGVSTDRNGAARDARPDVGAFEAGAATGANVPPAPPVLRLGP